MDFRVKFPHAYCVTLARRSDRWGGFVSQFDAPEFGDWKPEKFLGVDGLLVDVPDSFLPGKSDKTRRGAFGCHESHVNLYRKALAEGWENILIFEDDCRLSKDGFSAPLNAALSELPDDWDLLYLGGQHVEREIQDPFWVGEKLLYCYNVNRTHAYAVNAKALRRILDYVTDPTHGDHIDWQLGRLQRLTGFNSYAVEPWVTYQAGGPSDIVHTLKRDESWPAWTAYHPRLYKSLKICYSRVGFGRLGLGRHAFDAKTEILGLPGFEVLSVHSPSRTVIHTEKPVIVYGGLDGMADANAPQILFIDGAEVMRVVKRWDRTYMVRLSPGYHALEWFTCGNNNGNAHTCLYFKEAEK